MATVMIGQEQIPVEYAYNIWTDHRIASIVTGVALIALLAVVGTYTIYPLQGVGLSSLGVWMLGTAGCITAVEIIAIIIWVKEAEPAYKLDSKRFDSLRRFEKYENAFDFSPPFKSGEHSFVAYLVKEGIDKRLIIFRDNELAGDFLDYISKEHHWAQPDQV